MRIRSRPQRSDLHVPSWRRQFQQPRHDRVLPRACEAVQTVQERKKRFHACEPLRARGERDELFRGVLQAGNEVLQQSGLAGARLTRQTYDTDTARTNRLQAQTD